MKLIACLIAASSILLPVIPAVAEPLCHMTTSSGRSLDLSGICGGKKESGIASLSGGSATSKVNLNDKRRRIALGKTSDGFNVIFDRGDVTGKTFDLEVGNSAGHYNFTYDYACRERRAFFSEVSITSAETGKTYPIEENKREEVKFDNDSMIDSGMKLACRQIGSPGF